MEEAVASPGFGIDSQWTSSLHESPEVKETSAMITIVLGNRMATRNEDTWSRTVTNEVRLSAYPIALWLASSWWRLRWEPLPISENPSLSWRMAHELAAAGYGYVWPRLLFASDGNSIGIWSAQSEPNSKDPVHYLTTASLAVDAKMFEREVDEFINNVLARLDATKVERTTLHGIWEEVIEERNHDELAAQRRLEAMLGFDPDECPVDVLKLFEDVIIPEAGASAIEEIAPVCATSDPSATIRTVVGISQRDGIHGQIEGTVRAEGVRIDSTMHVWEIGWSLAKRVRNQLGLDGSPISNKDLSHLLGLQKTELEDVTTSAPRMPLGFAIRGHKPTELEFFLRKRNLPQRRFELARFLCDYLIADRKDVWLPVTDARTARQRIQRAFAAEFLCPIEALKSYLGEDLSQDAIEEAADHFQVAIPTVELQLVNNRELPYYYIVSDHKYVSRFLHSGGLETDFGSTM